MAGLLPTGPARFGGGGLELWLVRAIQQGTLKDLPLYHPLGARAGQHPEQYARTLLAELSDREGDLRAQERTRDDGRAFRSWAESVPTIAQCSNPLRSVC